MSERMIDELIRDAARNEHQPPTGMGMVISMLDAANRRLDYVVGEMTPLDPSIVEIHNVIDDLKLIIKKLSELEA